MTGAVRLGRGEGGTELRSGAMVEALCVLLVICQYVKLALEGDDTVITYVLQRDVDVDVDVKERRRQDLGERRCS